MAVVMGLDHESFLPFSYNQIAGEFFAIFAIRKFLLLHSLLASEDSLPYGHLQKKKGRVENTSVFIA